MPKPTETRFKVPTAAAANSKVSISPSPSVNKIGTIKRQERTARNSHKEISRMLPTMPVTAPSATEANSSSDNATLPVIRTRADPDLTNSSPAATARIASVAAPPGWSLV